MKVLAAKTHARNGYRRMPIPLRRAIDGVLGTGIYKPSILRQKALFIHVPKSAGTSVSQSIFGLRSVGHYTAKEAQRYDPKLFNELFKFGFVRNPITRSQSAYRYLRTDGTPEVPVAFPQRYAHVKDLNFDEFVEWLSSIDVDSSSPVVHRQTTYLCDDDGNLLVDFVGRFESISEDFQTVCNRLNINATLEHTNASTSRVKKTLDPRTLQRLREIYASDFHHFQYD